MNNIKRICYSYIFVILYIRQMLKWPLRFLDLFQTNRLTKIKFMTTVTVFSVKLFFSPHTHTHRHVHTHTNSHTQ